MSHVTLKIEFAALAHNTPIPTYTHMCTCNIYVWKLTAYLSVFQISCEHIAFDCIHVSDILHSCVGLDVSQTHQVHVFMLMCLRHIKFTHVTWLIFYPWHDLFILRHIKSMCSCVHSHMWHDSSFILDMTCSFTHVTWPIRIFHMTCSSVWYDPFLNATWIIGCNVTYAKVAGTWLH